MSLFVRIKKGIGSTITEQIANILMQLLIVPLCISIWGSNIYSEWLLLYTIPSMLAISDFGFSKAAINEMTVYYSKEDVKNFNLTYVNIAFLNIILCLAIFILILFTIIFVPNSTFENIFHYIPSSDVRLIIIFLSIYGLFVIQNFLHFGIYAATKKFHFSVYSNVVFRLLDFITLVVCVFLNESPLVASLCLCIQAILKTIIFRIVIKKNYPWLTTTFISSLKNLSKPTIKRLSKPALGFVLVPLGNSVKLQLPISLIGVSLGTSYILPFTTTRTLVNLGAQLMHVIVRPFMPEISMHFGKNDLSFLRNLQMINFGICLIVSIVFSAILFFLYPQILVYWTHGSVTPAYDILLAFITSLVISSISLVSSYFLYSINKHMQISIAFFIFVLISFCSSILLVGYLKLLGVSLALVLFELIYSIYCLYYSSKIFKASFWTSVKEASLSMFKIHTSLKKIRGVS